MTAPRIIELDATRSTLMRRKTYAQKFNRDDEAETDVTVEYTISGGCPAHYGSLTYPGHPAEDPEVEIVKAYTADGPVDLTDAEDARFREWIIENPEDDYDDPRDSPDYFDDLPGAP